MSDIVIQRLQTKPQRVDIVIIREDNIEEIAKLIRSDSYAVEKELSSGKKYVSFYFGQPQVRSIKAQFGDVLALKVYEADSEWDWAPMSYLSNLEPLNENLLTVKDIRDFAPPYDH